MRAGTSLDTRLLSAHPLPPVAAGDKDSKGKILIVAGSRKVPGAALLSALGAMRAGAGKLQIAISESAAPGYAIAMPEAAVIALPETRSGALAAASVDIIRGHACDCDAVVAGPGLESGDICGRIAGMLLATNARLAFDAALLHSLEPLPPRVHEPAPVLLPHSGELASLLDCEPDEVEADPVRAGRRAAELYRSVVLVKGVTSHVVTPDGRLWTYEGGAPGLGVSGSGDVLAGIVGGLLARGAEPLTALMWGVWLHGEAGRALSKRIGPVGFLAREIAGEVPALLAR